MADPRMAATIVQRWALVTGSPLHGAECRSGRQGASTGDRRRACAEARAAPRAGLLYAAADARTRGARRRR